MKTRSYWDASSARYMLGADTYRRRHDDMHDIRISHRRGNYYLDRTREVDALDVSQVRDDR